MKPPSRAAAIALLTSALACGIVGATEGTARADDPPSIWDRTRDPNVGPRYQKHVEAMRALRSRNSEIGDGQFEVHHALLALEDAITSFGADATLRYDLGLVLEEMRDYRHAISVLTKVLADAPDHPAAVLAWDALAIAYARVEQPDEEIRAYEKYLALETRLDARASATMNMAEAEMTRGQLGAAIRGYEDAIREAQQIRSGGGVMTYVLAIWGLAVALDRNGDATGAMREASRAVSHDPHLAIISAPDDVVFFVPAYERYFYQGLGELALADSAASARGKAEHWDKARRRFRMYLEEATPNDRWVARARAHFDFAESRLKTNHAPIAKDPEF